MRANRATNCTCWMNRRSWLFLQPVTAATALLLSLFSRRRLRVFAPVILPDSDLTNKISSEPLGVCITIYVDDAELMVNQNSFQSTLVFLLTCTTSLVPGTPRKDTGAAPAGAPRADIEVADMEAFFAPSSSCKGSAVWYKVVPWRQNRASLVLEQDGGDKGPSNRPMGNFTERNSSPAEDFLKTNTLAVKVPDLKDDGLSPCLCRCKDQALTSGHRKRYWPLCHG